MSSRRSRLLVVAGLALGLVGLGTATASATLPHLWTVSAGPAPTGSMPQFTGTSGEVLLLDFDTSQGLTCSSSSTKVDVMAVGTGLSGNHIAKISGSQSAWTGCDGPANAPFQVGTARFWDVNALIYNKSTGVTSGNVNNVHLQVFSSAAQCEATVVGAVAFQYTNSTQVLALQSNRFTFRVTEANCGTAIAVGDFIGLAVNFHVSPVNAKNTPLVITHP